MSNDSVISALEAGLAASPGDLSLMKHLLQLLTASDQHQQRALELAQQIITKEPANTEILATAKSLAEKLGDIQLAESYTKLLNALGAPAIATAQTKSPTQESGGRVRGAKLRLVSDSNEKSDTFVEIEDSQIYLDDVGGMEHVKKRLRLSFLAPLNNPELMKAYGKSVGGGLMLYGPPGCGKTFIARALAGELGAKFINIGLTDILDMYVGESERKLHELFENARRHSPAVLFIDELDALGQKRSQLRSSGMRTLVNQLLTEMDSMAQNNDSLFVLAATNHPWDVDAALRRPGRFDRIVAVYPPDLEARKAILQHHLKKRPAGDVDVDKIAQATHLYSGADLAHLCNAAVEYVLEESIESGQVRGITTQDFELPLKETKASTRPWFDTARNYAMFANENGSYDELLEYINQHKL